VSHLFVRLVEISCQRSGLLGGVGVPLADGAGGAAFVSDARQVSRSRVSPAEQVGEQIEGIGGCRPSLGNGGRSAGCTDGGAIGGNEAPRTPGARAWGAAWNWVESAPAGPKAKTPKSLIFLASSRPYICP
jgi:hypothetical protein